MPDDPLTTTINLLELLSPTAQAAERCLDPEPEPEETHGCTAKDNSSAKQLQGTGSSKQTSPEPTTLEPPAPLEAIGSSSQDAGTCDSTLQDTDDSDDDPVLIPGARYRTGPGDRWVGINMAYV